MMTGITKITVQLWTASDAEAGTNGFVYLGIAGREFHLETSRDDFEAGDNYTYIFGDDADRYPVYLRFEGKDNDDAWCLEGVTVTVNPGGTGTRTYDNEQDPPPQAGLSAGVSASASASSSCRDRRGVRQRVVAR
ncbi:PLAT/LH2 domain-containing protein [Streptomyces sp. BB1-1-1]|uniref:PLAT/LH2 domain-containing protein n=1 Tax=Streptomyces sp. BB1-1-1 TaxID=3074430 RepID=UPI0028775781|nr:PLAT/LH2 domain-containing protein [Streptomyces sp. BB1-1-1]WND35920.1 PLAT/LH2 domain-containing protein [Streptomyces sp. BB1-1-1]